MGSIAKFAGSYCVNDRFFKIGLAATIWQCWQARSFNKAVSQLASSPKYHQKDRAVKDITVTQRTNIMVRPLIEQMRTMDGVCDEPRTAYLTILSIEQQLCCKW